MINGMDKLYEIISNELHNNISIIWVKAGEFYEQNGWYPTPDTLSFMDKLEDHHIDIYRYVLYPVMQTSIMKYHSSRPLFNIPESKKLFTIFTIKELRQKKLEMLLNGK